MVGPEAELAGAAVDKRVGEARQVAGGQQEFIARFMLGMYQAAHDGYFAGVDPLLAELLGREPRTVSDLIA